MLFGSSSSKNRYSKSLGFFDSDDFDDDPAPAAPASLTVPEEFFFDIVVLELVDDDIDIDIDKSPALTFLFWGATLNLKSSSIDCMWQFRLEKYWSVKVTGTNSDIP